MTWLFKFFLLFETFCNVKQDIWRGECVLNIVFFIFSKSITLLSKCPVWFQLSKKSNGKVNEQSFGYYIIDNLIWNENTLWNQPTFFKGHLYAHIQRVHSEKYNSMGRDYVDSITCSSCDKPFSSGNLYLSHYQLKHGGFPPEYNDKEKFFCDQCPKIFLEKHRLASHKRSGVILIVEL